MRPVSHYKAVATPLVGVPSFYFTLLAHGRTLSPILETHKGRRYCRASLSASSAAATSDFIQRAPKIPTSPAITSAGVQVINSALLRYWPVSKWLKSNTEFGSNVEASLPTSVGAKASPSRCANNSEM